ncbi:MAG: DHHW family protein [Eubacteriales bacterium]
MKSLADTLKHIADKYYRLSDSGDIDLSKYKGIKYVDLSFSTGREKGAPRALSLVNIVLFLVIIFGLAVAFLTLPDKDFSENENRRLQQFPKFSLSEVVKKNFIGFIDDYYADQFPARPFFVSLKAGSEGVLWRGENKGILYGKDGWLIQRGDYYDNLTDDMDSSYTKKEMYESMEQNVYAVASFENALDNPVLFAPIPRKVDVMSTYYPPHFSSLRHGEHFDKLEEIISGTELSSVDLKSALLAHNDEYIFYRTDHHWTMLGAYYSYRAIMEGLGETPLDEVSFTKEVLSDSFYGTSWSKSGAVWVKPDTMELWSTKQSFTLDIMGKRVLEGFVDRELLNAKDKYSAYIGGISGGTKIRLSGTQSRVKDGEEREKLLLICDSYGQSLAPFLAQHFDVDVIDMRYFKSSMKKYIEDNGVSRVVVLNGLEGLMTQRTLVGLSLGLE